MKPNLKITNFIRLNTHSAKPVGHDFSKEFVISDAFWLKLKSEMGIRREQKFDRETVTAILGALRDNYLSHWSNGVRPVMFFSNSQQPDHYQRVYGRDFITYNMAKSLRLLKAAGYLYHQPGRHYENSKFPGKISASLKFKNLVHEIKPVIDYERNVKVDGKYVPYGDERLTRINKLLHSTKVEVMKQEGKTWAGSHPLEFDPYWIQYSTNRRHFGRIFSNRYQSLKKEYRQRMMINGNPTVELDFVSSQFRLLYATQGVKMQPPEGDLYHVEGVSRKTVKKVVMLLMNPGDGDWDGDFYPDQLKALDGIDMNNPGITDWDGAKTYQLEGAICLGIVDELAKQGIPCVSIHDSFIVEDVYQDILRCTMDTIYTRYTGFRPVIN